MRRSLVSEDQLIGKESTVTLIDETKQQIFMLAAMVAILDFRSKGF